MLIPIDALLPFLLFAFTPTVILALCAGLALRASNDRMIPNARQQGRVVQRAAIVVTIIGCGVVVAAVGSLGSPQFDTLKISGLLGVLIVVLPVSAIPLMSALPMYRLASRLRKCDEDCDIAMDEQIRRCTTLVERWKNGFVVIAVFEVALTFWPLVLLMIAMIPPILWMWKRNQESQLLWLLSLSVSHKRDLGDAVAEFALFKSGSYAASLSALAHDLAQGLSLSEALKRRTRLLPRWIESSIGVAEECDCLDEVLRECAQSHARWIRDRYRIAGMSNLVTYITLYCAAATMIVSFLCYYIVPKFKRIFEGFETRLPETTELVIAAAEFAVNYAPLLLLPFVILFSILVWDHRGWRNLSIPVFSRLYAVFDSGGILRTLSQGVSAGKPLPAILRVLAVNHYRSATAKRIASVFTQVEEGGDCWQALKNQRLLSDADVAVIGAAERAGNLGWALNEIAETRETRLKYRAELTLQFLRPAVVLLMGLLVAFICIGMFMPLVKLTNDLS